MEITVIYEDERTRVKKVCLNGKFMYTVTYVFDAEGFVDKTVRVFADGTVDAQGAWPNAE